MLRMSYVLCQVALVASAGIITSCSGSDGTLPSGPDLATVDVTVGASVIEVGQLTSVTAIALDQQAEPIPGDAVFSSSAPNVAEVDAKTGRIIAHAAGSVEIFATISGRTGQRTITVLEPVPIKINEIVSNGD